MTKKEHALLQSWLNDISALEAQQKELWADLGDMYVTRGGGDRPTCSLLAHYNYLLTCDDERARNRATNIWTRYHAISAQIDDRMQLGQALANIRK